MFPGRIDSRKIFILDALKSLKLGQFEETITKLHKIHNL